MQQKQRDEDQKKQGIEENPHDQESFRERIEEDSGTAIEEARQEFSRLKAATTQKTSYGLTYSPQYLRQSRAQKSEDDEREGQAGRATE